MPRSFATSPSAFQEFMKVFVGDESKQSHQIGSCQVHEDNLFVGVGDGGQAKKSVILESTLGKILRMSLDGNPVPDNPFFVDESQTNARNYVWASGLRNPFGLRMIKDQLFVADNGSGVDRFIQIEVGRDYLWAGSDEGIAAAADLVLLNGRGVTQFDFYDPESDLFPDEYGSSFFLAVSGDANNSQRPPSIQIFEYSINEHRVVSVPDPFLSIMALCLKY